MNKVALIILDGFGEGKDYSGNAVTHARTPTLDRLKKEVPWMLLNASGESVGIPDGTQGGSEVGHFTIGAGRVIFQSLEEINRSILNGTFYDKKAFADACDFATSHKGSLHLMGMISDQGVHAHIQHLFALLEMAKRQNVNKIFIHAITDGRDVPERSAIPFIKQIQEKISELGLSKIATIGSIVGRYFAMDRDSNWDKRIKPAYDLYSMGKGIKESDPVAAIEHAYDRGVETDYYIDPIILDESAVIKESDAVIFWNFRTDRARQITWCFTGESIGFNPEKVVRPFFVAMGPYSEKAPVVFPTPEIKHNLGEVISDAGLKQLRVAETQKYAHVTYFLNSQIETPLKGEERIMVDSPKCHSYAEMPAMHADKVTDIVVENMNKGQYHFIAVNYANCDLVGHSGVFSAAVTAVETIDACLARVIEAAEKTGYTVLITGDHGNIEYMTYEENGDPCPSHTKNPVPFFVVTPDHSPIKLRDKGELQDIAPTVLHILELPAPSEFHGKDLIL